MMNLKMVGLVLSIALVAAVAPAAVVVDGTSTSTSGELSWTHTVKAGTDAVLAVCPGGGGYNETLASDDAVVTYTYGNQTHTMDKAVYEYGNVGSGQEYHGLYYAALGDLAADMDVTLSIDFKATTGRDAHSALNLYGVSQDNPIGKAGAVIGGSTTLQVDLTGCQSGSLVLSTAHMHYNGSLAADAPITEVIPNTEHGSARCAAGTIDVTSGDVTAGWTRSGGNRMGVAAVEFVPEPTTMGLLALGSLVAIRRRKA